MTHAQHRPTPMRRLQAFYPVRESDGDEVHVGTMLDLRQVRIQQARDTALRYLRDAHRSRADGSTWALCMKVAAEHRALYGGLLRSGGRVNWRGEPL